MSISSYIYILYILFLKIKNSSLSSSHYFCFLPLPHSSTERALYEEVCHMQNVSFEHVVKVYGYFKGGMGKGIVMEFMRRGSIQSLQNDLSGPPPWPLCLRLARQVALAINFLHSKGLMHQDLTPSNVLLNDDLNAKVVVEPILLKS